MKKVRFVNLLTIILATATLFQPIASNAREPNIDSSPYAQPAQPNENDLNEHKHYINSDGNEVHSPAHSVSGAPPQNATAQCQDGTYSLGR